MKISDELLSELLDENVVIFNHSQFPHGENGIRYRFNVNSGRIEWINIYELAHLCKRWLHKNRMLEVISNDDGYMVKIYGLYGKAFIADTEPEAIFKACEYILEQNKKDK